MNKFQTILGCLVMSVVGLVPVAILAESSGNRETESVLSARKAEHTAPINPAGSVPSHFTLDPIVIVADRPAPAQQKSVRKPVCRIEMTKDAQSFTRGFRVPARGLDTRSGARVVISDQVAYQICS